MKVKDARKTLEALQGLMSKKLPIKMAFAVQKNEKKIREVVEFADKRQNDIVEKNAKKDDKGEMIPSEDGKGILIEDREAFITEMNELVETDMPVELDKVAMSDIERCDEDRFESLSPKERSALECMIEE